MEMDFKIKFIRSNFILFVCIQIRFLQFKTNKKMKRMIFVLVRLNGLVKTKKKFVCFCSRSLENVFYSVGKIDGKMKIRIKNTKKREEKKI